MSSINNYINGRKLRPRNDSHRAITGTTDIQAAFQQPEITKPMVSLKKPVIRHKPKQKNKIQNATNANKNAASILCYLKPIAKKVDDQDVEASKLDPEPSLEGKTEARGRDTHSTYRMDMTEDADSDDEPPCRIRKTHPFINYWQTILDEFESAASMIESPYQSPSLSAVCTGANEDIVKQLALKSLSTTTDSVKLQKRKLNFELDSSFRNVRMRSASQPLTQAAVLRCYEESLSDEEDEPNEEFLRPLRRKYTLKQTNEHLSEIFSELFPYETNSWFCL